MIAMQWTTNHSFHQHLSVAILSIIYPHSCKELDKTSLEAKVREAFWELLFTELTQSATQIENDWYLRRVGRTCATRLV